MSLRHNSSEDHDGLMVSLLKESTWSSQDVEQLLWSVDTIHNAFCILDLAKYGDLHAKTFDIVLSQIAKVDSIIIPPVWTDLIEPLVPLYRSFNQEPSYFTTKILLELFDLLTGYIDENERLHIDRMIMKSPGEIVWKRLKKYVTRLQEPAPKQFESTVFRTGTLMERMVSGSSNTKLKIIHENRQVDPRLLDLVTRVIFDQPADHLMKLAASGKIKISNKNSIRTDK